MGQSGLLLIMGVLAVMLLALAWRLRLEWLVNLLLRGVLGAVAIYFINLAAIRQGYAALVGINPATVLTCSVLGFPGLAALYGLQIFYLL
ncbi:MAG: pro-sigmaK processing inhibitor BofA family protein [bacterium]|nr:pro-sigmaK processing inhibitor BofA family protein [bacterium]MCM1374701.1 pro-sigmaK processing inhibitor BofA family protein [Muribaculum sp.]